MERVGHSLMGLAGVQVNLPELVGASTFSVIASAMMGHVGEARSRGWALPVQLGKEASVQEDR